MKTKSNRQPKRSSKPREAPLRQRMKEERKAVYRQAISEAAERVFAAKGADGTRMSEIAAEAGVSLGTLYGVIDGKSSLFFEIHRIRMRGFLSCIREARDAHNDTLSSHLAVLRDGAQYFLDRPDFLRMCSRDGYAWASRLPASAGGELWDEGASVPIALFVRGIAEGIYVDEDPELLARKMLALKQVELTFWVDHGLEAPHGSILNRLENQFIRAFCVRET